MIGYHRTLLTMPPVVAQAFDDVSETDRNTLCGQVKFPGLEDYDRDHPNDDNDWLSVALDRWGDLRVFEHRI